MRNAALPNKRFEPTANAALLETLRASRSGYSLLLRWTSHELMPLNLSL